MWTRIPLWLVVVGLIGVLSLVAVLAGQDEPAPRPGTEETRPVTVRGAPLPALAEGPDPGLGLVAPEVAGSTFDGAAVSITQDGRPKIVIFLAHWCPHCQSEVPVVTSWLKADGMPTEVDIYAVATGTSSSRPNYPPSRWLEGAGWPVRTMADDADSSTGQAFGLSAFPYFVVLDAQHRVVARTTGELPVAELRRMLDAAAGGTAG